MHVFLLKASAAQTLFYFHSMDCSKWDIFQIVEVGSAFLARKPWPRMTNNPYSLTKDFLEVLYDVMLHYQFEGMCHAKEREWGQSAGSYTQLCLTKGGLGVIHLSACVRSPYPVWLLSPKHKNELTTLQYLVCCVVFALGSLWGTARSQTMMPVRRMEYRWPHSGIAKSMDSQKESDSNSWNGKSCKASGTDRVTYRHWLWKQLGGHIVFWSSSFRRDLCPAKDEL